VRVTANRAAVKVPLRQASGMHSVIAESGNKGGDTLIKTLETDGAQGALRVRRLGEHGLVREDRGGGGGARGGLR